MAVKITVTLENFKKGTTVGISGVEVPLESGIASYLDNEAEANFELLNGKTIYEAFKDSETVKVERVAESSIPNNDNPNDN